ncbi:MAG: methionine gamma-lyase family protein [Christensenellales bacterium]
MLLDGISESAVVKIQELEESLAGRFAYFDEIGCYNQNKVLEAFSAVRVESRHFAPSTGYGYGDLSRDTLDALFAQVFRAEAALVRPQFANATHALATALFAALRPGDEMVCATGPVYDTLRPVVGEGEESRGEGSLRDFGIGYHEIALAESTLAVDVDALLRHIASRPRTRLVYLQRSGGYDWRPALSIGDLRRIIAEIRKNYPDMTVLVDNCYGEFVEAEEPLEAGADLIVGSLIKNPGGGLAPTGAYIAGRADLVEKAAFRLTVPGAGAEVGSYAASYLPFYQGLFLAPSAVNAALRGAALLAAAMESLGFALMPAPNAVRSDIIQAIRFGNREKLIAFCRCVQAASPVESHVTPEPWAMPGYADEVIMAAGTFIQGSSLEMTADAPIREPYIGYWQGGLTYAHCRIAVMRIYERLRSV